MKCISSPSYPGYNNILKTMAKIWNWLKGNSYMLIVFLTACCTDEQAEGVLTGKYGEVSMYGVTSSLLVSLEKGARVPAYLAGEEERTRVIHEASKVAMGYLQECVLKRSVLKKRELV